MAKSTVLSVNGSYVAYAHAALAYAAFLSALAIGCFLHYHKIVENAYYGHPDEWFPSVSAAIGDRHPERSFFQVLIACTSGPHFLLIFLNFITSLGAGKPVTSYILLGSGFIRTFTCIGWVYITSTDDYDWHIRLMIGYIVLTFPWMFTVTLLTPRNTTLRTGRALMAIAFFGTLVPLVYWLVQHKVHVRPGAYSIYAYFEWSLILLDVGFDTCSVADFKNIVITILSTGVELQNAGIAQTSIEEKTQETIEDAGLDDFTLVEFLVNTVNSFVFWSVLTSLMVCVWYFPLWHMGISGYEAVIAVTFLAPFLIAIPPFGAIFRKYPQLTKTLIVLLGLGSFKVETPEKRLALITAGTGFGVVALACDLDTLVHNPKKYTSVWISLLIGLMGTSVAKFSNFSNNPAWPIMNNTNGGYNEHFIAVGVVAALMSRAHINVAAKGTKDAKIAKDMTVARKGGSLLLASLGLGAYFFCLQAYLSDSSTLIYWTWEGFPVRGPTPLTGALFHFAVFAGGIIVSLKAHPNTLQSPLYTLASFAAAYVLYTFHGWLGFAGSLGLTFYLASLGPLIGQATAGYNIVALFCSAFLVSVLLSLASIWIVAYAFVPGGPLLRERTDLVLLASVGFLALGVFNYGLRKNTRNITRLEIKGSQILGQTMKILTALLTFSAVVMVRRTPSGPNVPYNAESRSFTTGIWCVHFGLDNHMWSSETRILDLLRDAQVDIVGLLETDTERLFGANRDFTQKIAHDLGMYVDYGPGPNKHTWGAALLSKFPIISSSHHLLPSPVGELSPAIVATLDIYGELVDVVVFHSGQEEDAEDRRLQSLGVQELMANSTRPLVLLSYLVTEPLEGNYNTYVSAKSRMHDIDSTDWDRWCEYILFRDLKKVAYARISRSTITDTELQIAKFKLLTDEQRQQGDGFVYGNHFIDESKVPAELRMPGLLKGDGVRGHRYHVFDAPRYFADSADQV